LLESFAMGACCERRLNRINKEVLVAMERWSRKWRKEEDAVAATENHRKVTVNKKGSP
jgi:hypothetical protein